MRLLLPLALVAWVGMTLLLGAFPSLRRPRLATRLSRHAERPAPDPVRARVTSLAAARDVLTPLAAVAGNRVAAVFGANERLDLRLRRAGVTAEPGEFRLQQVVRATIASLIAVAGAAILPIPAVVALGLVVGAPLLTFLVIEQSVATASERWQRGLTAELPVVAEQLGMLLSSGYSLGGAMARLAHRGHGRGAAGFASVVARTRQGLGELAALREWGQMAEVPALDRLISTLELNAHASDLGELISAEARTTRREVHRALDELIERRQQTVWIPVTVATLLPGVIFMAVPFIDAMGKLTGA
jgi:Flp pilus assembly protein TadB